MTPHPCCNHCGSGCQAKNEHGAVCLCQMYPKKSSVKVVDSAARESTEAGAQRKPEQASSGDAATVPTPPAERDVIWAAAEVIIENFHAPDERHPSWWINPGEMARALDSAGLLARTP
jgi:hypothetical protein